MRWPNAFRRRSTPIAGTLAAVSSQVEDIAQHLYEMALSVDHMPDQAQIDATAERLARELLEPAVERFTRNGHPADDIEAYRSLLDVKVRATFAAKWSELARLHTADTARGAH